MKNIAVKVTDDAYHEARVWAAAHATSISAIVQHCIQNLPKLRSTNEAMMQIVREREEALYKNSAAQKQSAHAPSAPPTATESTTSSASKSVAATPA